MSVGDYGRGVAIAAILLASCTKPAPVSPARAAAPATIDATAITLRSVTRPDETVRRHDLLIANGRIRSTDEIDRWRLFDLEAETVTFVDDVTRTFRAESRAALLQRRARALASAPPVPAAATVERADTTEIVDGYEAQRLTVRLGGFERELWITDAIAVDAGFFAFYFAAEPLDPDGLRAMEHVIAAFDGVRGFPVVDRIRVTWGDESIEIETRVERVGPREVPIDWLRVPEDYRDESLTESSSGPRPASSPRSDRSARAGESRSSATGRSAP